MRNFEKLFDSLVGTESSPTVSGMTLLTADAALSIYYGVGSQGNLRLGFLADSKAPDFNSTRAIRVSVVAEGDSSNWVLFDLIESAAAQVYYTFCDDLVSTIENAKDSSQTDALTLLKNRFMAWRQMFRQERTSLTDEQTVGLLGELYFLQTFMIPRFGATTAVSAWSGVDGLSKDFSVQEQWYEIKTASINATSIKINSLAQLSSDKPGGLAVVRYEEMSDQYDDPTSSILKLFKSIMTLISDDETRVLFISKIIRFGFDVTGSDQGHRYRILGMTIYKVDDAFPRIQVSDVNRKEIDKVTYTLLINTLDPYRFDGVLS